MHACMIKCKGQRHGHACCDGWPRSARRCNFVVTLNQTNPAVFHEPQLGHMAVLQFQMHGLPLQQRNRQGS